MNRKDAIIARLDDIPALPAAALDVIRLVQDPDVDMSTLTRAIEFDPGLTTNLLRLANSAYFGCPRSIGTVREAVVRLGMWNVSRLLLPLAVAPVVRLDVRGYDLLPGALLDHSIAVAAGAQAIADERKATFPRETFTAALLHDVGKIVLGSFVEVDFREIEAVALRENQPFEEAERAVLGIDHAEAGAMLLERWNCPESIVIASRWHHRPEDCVSGGAALALVHLADAISILEGIGAGSDGLRYRVSESIFASWALPEEAVERVACRMVAAVSEAKGMYAAATGGAR